MVDIVFWTQTRSLWVTENDYELADKDTIKKNSCSEELTDELMDYSFDLSD